MRIGFIGCGNMASAIIGGILKNEIFAPEDVVATAASEATKARAKETFGITIASDNAELVRMVDIVVLAIKPQYYESVINEVKEAVGDHQWVMSIAPGKTLEWLGEKFGKPVKLIRTMPNTPAMVGKGMTAMCYNDLVSEADLEIAGEILSGIGEYEIVGEHLMDAVVGVSGSAPAYVFMFIEAMADAAVMGGMPRKQAYKFAAQAVEGSAAMVRELGLHPGELKDMVCSPAGTTIEAVAKLEERGMRSAVMEAMRVCMEKSSRM